MKENKSQNRIRVAVAGCGRFSETGHLVPYFLHPDVELAAVCDVREDAARKMASRYRIEGVFTEFERMLDEVRPDAVSVCTPTFTHAELVVAAAARGVHVLCEKPMSASPADGGKMITACRDAGVVLHVGYQKRCDRGLIKLRTLLREKTYGECFQAEMEWRGLSTFGNVPAVNRLMGLAHKLGISTEAFSPGWRFTDARCPGGVFEVICHLIDLAIWFFGAPEKVEGEVRTLSPDCTRPDHAVILLTGKNKQTTYLTMSHRALALNEDEKGRFRCSGGNILYHTDSTRQAFLPAKLTVQTDEWLFGRTREFGIAPLFSPTAAPHYRKVDNFVKAVRGELPVEEEDIVCTGEQALDVDEVVDYFVREAKIKDKDKR